MFIHGKRLRYYGGNYDTFLKVRAEHRAHAAAHSKQTERRVSALKGFIQRFGQGHKKMAKQAQARMKMLAKLQDEPCEVRPPQQAGSGAHDGLRGVAAAPAQHIVAMLVAMQR